uniref:EARP complex and GARP complex interacting protein 1 n=1 Tax=Tetraodon nigroviridis TaxID=99883 RepID=H3DN50_TETNG
MEDDAPVIYGLEFQARALTPQTGETDAIRFLVGTQSLKFDNQIHIIDFDDENNIINKNVLSHQSGEIWHIAACPADKTVFTTCYNKTCDGRVTSCASVWRMPSDWETGNNESPEDSAHNPQTLELLCHLENNSHSNTACVLWEPMGDGKRLISLADNHALLWDLQESSTQATISSRATLEGKGQLKFTSGKWSPHHNGSQFATANDTSIRGWDLRSMRSCKYCLSKDWGQSVVHLDFNYHIFCGKVCIKVCMWTANTMVQFQHMVWSVRYNHSHDQLVLTASSDSRLILSNMVSISSEPFGHLVDEDELSEGEDNYQEDKGKEPLKDSVVSTYEEHEDSVYAAEWSSADPWLFASLSYDGRLVINRVPRALKYRILL